MSKRNLDWTQNKLERFLKEGRGQGVGKEYKPWLTIQDIPSRGRASRLYSSKTDRLHHLFTDMETNLFYLFNWEDTVIDIREHYPLLDMLDTVENTNDIELHKLVDKKTKTPYIVTTSFLLTLKANGKKEILALSVKSTTELDKKYQLKLLEIQRRYWEAKGIKWFIVTQKDIPTVKSKNIEWLYTATDGNRGLSDEEIEYLSAILQTRLKESNKSVRKIASDFDNEFYLDSGTGVYLFKYLVAKKTIKVDIDKKIDINTAAHKVIMGFKEEKYYDISSGNG